MPALKRATVTFALLGVVVASALVRTADASTSVAVTWERLVQASTSVATVTPVTQTSVWEGGRIVTYTDAHVDEPVAGAPLAEHVWVRTLGGDVGRLGQLVEGEAVFTVGRPSLVFLRPATMLAAGGGASPQGAPGPYAVTARGQGQFAVVVDPHGDLRLRHGASAASALAPRAAHEPGAPEPAPAVGVLDGLRVADAAAALADAWRRFH
jgi:hypothetical protein